VGRTTTLLGRVLGATFCGVVSVHAALVPFTSIHLSPARVVVTGTSDEGAGKAALKQPDGMLLAAAMQAAWKSELPCSELRSPQREHCRPRQSTTWLQGASFARSYVPPRVYRVLAPPAENDPDA
jgi:hypothetical protein